MGCIEVDGRWRAFAMLPQPKDVSPRLRSDAPTSPDRLFCRAEAASR